MTKIAAAAIRFEGVLYSLPPPHRHHHIIRLIVDTTGVKSIMHEEQGFIDDQGNFLDRETAMKVAQAAGQIIDGRAPVLRELYSENLW